MSDLKIRHFQGLNALRELANDWNDLWMRSYTASPTVRAEPISHWVQMFRDDRDLTVVTVARNNQLVAAIPLVKTRVAGLTVHGLPVNCWSNNGDLLVDHEQAFLPVMDALVTGMQQSGARLLSLDEVAIDAEHWSLFRSALKSRGLHHLNARQRPVGVIDCLGDWPAYTASWPSKFRSSIKRNRKQLDGLGTLEITCHRNPTAEEIPRLMRAAFAIEHNSWKGEAGSSIQGTAGMADYFIREAELMADARALDLWFLNVNGKPLAFEYCHLAKGHCYCHKIGYDADFRTYGLGKILRHHQLERYHADPACDLFDTLGVYCHTKAKWSTRTYQVGRIYASLGGPIAQSLIRGYALAKPLLRRAENEDSPPPAPAARSYLDAVAQQTTTAKQAQPVSSPDQAEAAV